MSNRLAVRSRAHALDPARLYDGRAFAGVIRERGKKITALTSTGKRIGTYRSRRAAMRAIPKAGGGS